MDNQKAEAIIEAVLFTMGDSVDLKKLAEVIEEDADTTKVIIGRMQERFQEECRGVSVMELDGAYQMCTKGELYEYLIKAVKSPRKYVLTDTILETLSIIAYKQPVTKLEIEKIRGVSCDHAVNKLVELDLAKELGRLDAPGRPLLFGTTEQFLRCFGLKDLNGLPELNQEQIDDFKIQAEEEISMKLEV